MKKINDEKIQEMVAANFFDNAKVLTFEEENELIKYQQLFKILSEEPVVELPENFSTQVVAQLFPPKKTAFKYSFHLIIVAIFVAGVVVATNIIQYDDITQLINIFIKNKWLILFCMVIFLLVHYADYKYVRKQATKLF